MNIFAGNPLDRSSAIKNFNDEVVVLDDPTTKFLITHSQKALCTTFKDVSNRTAKQNIKWFSTNEVNNLLGVKWYNKTLVDTPVIDREEVNSVKHHNWVLLGLDKGDGSHRFALDLTNFSTASDVTAIEANHDCTFESTRALLSSTPPQSLSIIGQACALTTFHSTNLFCGSCGKPTIRIEAGRKRTCSSKECKSRQYPRIDPVAIVLVHDPVNQKIMLGNNKNHPKHLYSCLAGFCEQSETLEECAHREIFEESGLSVTDLRYISSQPWPVGRAGKCEIMTGFFATASVDDKICIDESEINDARWFSRDDIRNAVIFGLGNVTIGSNGGLSVDTVSSESEGKSDNGKKTGGVVRLSIPGDYAIAHHLIMTWLNQEQ